jgi:hypothetical protein
VHRSKKLLSVLHPAKRYLRAIHLTELAIAVHSS